MIRRQGRRLAGYGFGATSAAEALPAATRASLTPISATTSSASVSSVPVATAVKQTSGGLKSVNVTAPLAMTGSRTSSIARSTERRPTTDIGRGRAISVAQERASASVVPGVTIQTGVKTLAVEQGVVPKQDVTSGVSSVQASVAENPYITGTGKPITASVRYEQPSITRSLAAPITRTIAALNPGKAIGRVRRNRHRVDPNWPITGIFAQPYGGYAVPWWIRKEPTGLSGFGADTASVSDLVSTIANYVILATEDVWKLPDLPNSVKEQFRSYLEGYVQTALNEAGSTASQAVISAAIKKQLPASWDLGVTKINFGQYVDAAVAAAFALIPTTSSSSTGTSTGTRKLVSVDTGFNKVVQQWAAEDAASSKKLVTAEKLTAAQLAALSKSIAASKGGMSTGAKIGLVAGAAALAMLFLKK